MFIQLMSTRFKLSFVETYKYKNNVTLAAHVQTCLKHIKELFSRTGNKKRPSTTNSLKNKRQI